MKSNMTQSWIRHCQWGATLVETLLGIAAGTLLLAAILVSVTKLMASSAQELQISRLNIELNNVLSMLTQDIRRAGFWGQASTNLGAGTNKNPYMAGQTDIMISNSCLLLAYDTNKDGNLPNVGTENDDERYGYRLKNNAVQARIETGEYTCNSSDTGWQNITDPKTLIVTDLQFTANERQTYIHGTGSNNPSMTVRNVTISITGRLATNANLAKTFTKTVHVYNNRFTS